MRLRDELPLDHRLSRVYGIGAALCGLLLLLFGCLGFAGSLSAFGTDGTRIAGLSTNGLLSLISVLFGLLLIGAATAGGNLASTVNIIVGVLFVASGFVHLFLIGKDANILDFGMSNVVFSFLMGLLVMTFGMYGRVSGGLDHDNPYWRRRHPEQAAREAAASLPRGAAVEVVRNQPAER
ncbi:MULTISPECIES: DUF4383 domain-containing protein [Streptomyces]|uniref:DUF4383 domain-containing protein n=1 Tax=Streptomyces TaxID=1883 RepID=UPI000F7AB98A|nr:MULTISPECIES: DUF4383 domain-containing protein [Streptomyces]RST04364.1 DUF4383 domain-containing protein [Streptomyces sp. WAC07149]GLX23190.1 hypothetical protein Slala01_68340 [Streptomyces lavendulae subsp. lavendulae]GLX30652.1 hypothetical protein Slala02_64720 [Streptomyces lavendulae subsp. lavendulae]